MNIMSKTIAGEIDWNDPQALERLYSAYSSIKTVPISFL
jgi:hypothetical protein